VFIAHDKGGGERDKWWFAKGDGVLHFHVNDGVPSAYLAQTPFTPELDRWYHLAVKREGDTFIVFIDGSPGNSEDYSHGLPNAATPLTIGEAETFVFNGGSLDDIAIYDRALTDLEIASVAAGYAIPEPVGMASLLTALAALAGYVRKRRRA